MGKLYNTLITNGLYDQYNGQNNMIVAVTGGRDFKDKRVVNINLSAIHQFTPISWLVYGNASGADTLAASWASIRGIPLWPFDADWEGIDAPGAVIKKRKDGRLYNALAGHWRNIEMLDVAKPKLLLSFPGGRGTAHCTKEAIKRGMDVIYCR